MKIPNLIFNLIFSSLLFMGFNLLHLPVSSASSSHSMSSLDTTFVDTLLFLCEDLSIDFYDNVFFNAGTYEVFVDNPVNDEDTLFFVELTNSVLGPFTINPENAIICLGEPLPVSIFDNGAEALGLSNVEWQDQMWFTCDTCSTTVFNGLGTVDFSVNFIDQDGCPQDLEGQYVTVSGCLIEQIVLPNVFTPNGDEINDYFEPLYSKSYQKLRNMKVFNRFGELVFESQEERGKWDGQFKDSPAPMDVYFYQIEVNCPALNATEIRVLRGEVTLLR